MRSSITKHIMIISVMIVFAFAAINIYTFFQIRKIEESYQALVSRNAPALAYAREALGELWCQNAQARGYFTMTPAWTSQSVTFATFI